MVYGGLWCFRENEVLHRGCLPLVRPYDSCPWMIRSFHWICRDEEYFANHQKAHRLSCGPVGSTILYVEKKTCEFVVQAARIGGFPSTIGTGFAEIGFIFESFRSSSSSLRCSCGCPLDLSTSMVFTRWRQAQSPLPLDRAPGKFFVLPSRLSLPRALAQD